MLNTAHRIIISRLALAYGLFGVPVFCITTNVAAQSTATFATMPYIPNPSAPAPLSTSQEPAAPMVTSPKYRGPPPVVMFRGTPPPPPVQQTDSAIEFVEPPAPVQQRGPQREYSIVNQAQRDAANTAWNPMSLDPVIAPPQVPGMAPETAARNFEPDPLAESQRYRGPVYRILRDTGRGIISGIPEAIAGALPWVDNDATNEPFDAVLARAADDLNKASKADPAWALPAQSEIRALSRRLDSLSAPPPLGQVDQERRPLAGGAGVDDRPFRPRPIWPGASGRPEEQVRPVTIVTNSGHQEGPRATGVLARYTPAAEDDDGNPIPKTAPPPPSSGARGTPVPRPNRRSR